jgi:hypothetical protein
MSVNNIVSVYLDVTSALQTNADPMYCQSKLKLNTPRPSLLSAPPNMLVKMSCTLGDACCEARQKMLKPLRSGNIYAGTIS